MATIQPHRIGMLISAFFAIAIIAAGAYYFATRGAAKRRRPTAAGRTPTVVTNARIYTVDDAQPWAEAFAIDERGIITFVGSTADALRASRTPVKVLDAEGNFLMPGLHDPHARVVEAGLAGERCEMPPGRSLAMYATRAANCARRSDAGWVRGVGLSLARFLGDDDDGPTPLELLDRAVPDRPALLQDGAGRVAWANSRALAAANLSASAPDPPGGLLERRDAEQLTGLLLEDAQQLVAAAAAPDAPTVLRAVLRAQKALAAAGVTSVSDPGGFWRLRGGRAGEAFRAAAAAGRASVRANNAAYLYAGLKARAQLPALRGLFEPRGAGPAEALARVGTVAVRVDGVLAARTAALVRVYDGGVLPGAAPRGFYHFKRTTLHAYAEALHRAGFQLALHAGGDAGVRRALDTLEHVARRVGYAAVRARRHRLTTLALVRPEQAARFHALGAVADFQVPEQATAAAYEDALTPYIGKTRARSVLPVAMLAAAGVPVTLSSDWGARPLDPLGTVARVLTRARGAVRDVGSVIRMVTANGAYALHQNDTGRIKVGYQADFVILDTDLLAARPADIARAQVLVTAVRGTTVYNKTAADAKAK